MADFPESGRLGRIAGTRELIPHENYRLVYEISASIVWILALVHTSRMWPPVRDNA
ncbi:type II toxin-antitoxin system RelE/ParE family toxin [Burkholderia pyrrocinia]|uniref:type II toxin-antitoxin system RelE/ParE family toxin n=1 Tax=Burkholderia pyrrocinia TaxID=60550 RepID=UPI0020C6910C|nr:type II toxin-antitoxin system RelE/ParE family toxin [Burkholderia pyrrocinia]